MVATCHEAWRLHYVQKPIDVKTEGLVVRSLFCFSALTNAKTLLNTTVNNQDNISCLNGIRVLTTTWVIMGHIWRWLSTRSNTIYNQNQLYDVSKSKLKDENLFLYIFFSYLGFVRQVDMASCYL